MLRTLLFSKGALAVEAAIATLAGITIDHAISGVLGALTAGIPTFMMLLKERAKDAAEVRHLDSDTDLSALQMVRQLLDEKAVWTEERALLTARLAVLEGT